VIGNYVNGNGRSFQVMTPSTECIEDREEFLVMSVVIQLRGPEGPWVKRNWMEKSIFGGSGQNCCDSVVGSVSFNSELRIWGKFGKDRGRGERGLEGLEGRAAFRIEVPWDILPSKPIEWSSDPRIILNKSAIEVGKSQEWLDIFDFARFRPISYSFDLGRIHSDSSGSYQESQVFHGSPMELAFLSFGVKLMTSKASQDFADLLLMRFQVIGVNQDVVEVDDDANIH
jgi:hypothetical protein